MNVANELMDKAKDSTRKNDLPAAKDLLRKAMRIDSGSMDAKVELARLEFITGNHVESERLLNETLSVQPQHALGLALRGAIKVLSRKYEDAVSLMQTAIKLNPEMGFAYVNLAIAQRELGLLEASEKNLRKAIEINPRDCEAYYSLAHTLCVRGRIEEALSNLLKTLEINPLFIKGYRALGKLYTLARRPELAEKMYDECLKRVPDAFLIREQLIELYLQFGKPDAAQAELEVLAQQRGNLSDWLRLGNISAAFKKFPVAERAFQRAAKVAHEAWEPHYNLGDLYDSTNLNDAAGKEYELAVKYNSDSFKPHNGMGLWLLKQNRIREAVDQFTIACKLAPENGLPAYNLALAMFKDGREEPAKHLLQALASSSQQESIRENAQKTLKAISAA